MNQYRETLFYDLLNSIRPQVDTPATLISGCGLWFRANNIVDADGASQTGWADLSGNGNHFTRMGSGGDDPILRYNLLNGKKGMEFRQNNDGLVGALDIQTLPFSTYVIYASRNAVNNANRVYDGQFGGANNWLVGPYSAVHSFYNGNFITANAQVAGEYNTFITTQANNDGKFYRNNVLIGSNANNNVPRKICLGRAGNWASPANSYVLEGGVWPTKVFSAAERNLLAAYILSFYGI